MNVSITIIIWAATWQNQQNSCGSSKDQPGHPPSLIRVFAVRMKKAWALGCPLSAQQWLRVFAGRTLISLVLSCRGSISCYFKVKKTKVTKFSISFIFSTVLPDCVCSLYHFSHDNCQKGYQFCNFDKSLKVKKEIRFILLCCQIWAMSWYYLFMPYANNKEADQPAHLHSLIDVFIVCCLDSMIPILAKSKISRL